MICRLLHQMKFVPLIPEKAPFYEAQHALISGFLSGTLNRGATPEGGAAVESKRPQFIAFGSQSGNAKSLVRRLAGKASGRGFAARAAGLGSLQF